MKNSRPLLLSRPMVIGGLVIAFALAAGTAVLSSISTREVTAAGVRVAVSQATLLEINQLLGSLIDAETGQRGYILTGLDSYLEPYTRASSRQDNQLAALRLRFAQSPAQLKTLDHIATLVADKDVEMSRTIELRRDSLIGPALHLVDSGKGLAAMNALRTGIHELEQRELSDLALHSANVGQRARFFQFTSLGMLFAAIGLAGTFGWLLLRRMHELEDMITVCAWTKRVKFNGAWISFEEYLQNRFNLQLTHGMSEEAARKLKMEEIELLRGDGVKYGSRPRDRRPRVST